MKTPLGIPLTPRTDSLHAELRTLIAASRQRLAGTVNAELTRLYWAVGHRLRREVLGGERAAYGSMLMDHLGFRLAAEFGRGFEAKNLHRMVQFAQAFPDAEIVATLSRQLNWSHIVTLLPLKDAEARRFYAQAIATEGWSVRELRRRIGIPPRPPFAKGGENQLPHTLAATAKRATTAVPPFNKGGLGGIRHNSAPAGEVDG
ncbi:MAG: DUF1016 N-terminal domain-containing protein [Thermodesulfobacteriota bacterium]